MPLYEYRCDACHHQFEKIQKFSDEPITVCPSCGQGPVVKLLSSPAIQFKGTGWYITDYAKKTDKGDKGEKGDRGAAGAETAGAKKDSAGSDTASTPAPASSTTKSGSTPAPAAKP